MEVEKIQRPSSSSSSTANEKGSRRSSSDEGETIYLKVMKTVALKVKSSDTIGNVKSKFQELEGVAGEHQQIYFAGNHLKDGRTLTDYDIKKGSTLHMFLNSGVGMQIFIKIPSRGRTVMLEVKIWDTIKNIKFKIWYKEGIQPDQQTLIYGGRPLEDGQTLATCNIQHKSTLHAVFRCDQMRIYVNNPTRGTITLEGKLWYTVQDIKAVIESMIGAPLDQYLLCYAGKYLEDCQTLSYYNIKPESTLDMVGPTMKISVRIAPIGKSIVLDCNIFDTIKEVKAKIQILEGIPLGEEALSYAGKSLEDNRTLAAYDIQKNFSLDIVGSMMQIFIKIPPIRTFSLEVNNLSTLESVKAKIQDKEWIPPDQLTLSHDARSLEEGQSLASYSIENESTLDATLHPECEMQIFVTKPMTRKNLAVNVNAWYEIRDVKALIERMVEVPQDQQQLVYVGKKLDDGRKSIDYKIKKDSILEVLCSSVQIFVKTCASRTITLEVKITDMTEEVISKIKQKLGASCAHMNLLFGGRQLMSKRTLSDYNVQKGSTLYMVMAKKPTKVKSQIILDTVNGESFVLDVELSDTIGAVRAKVMAMNQVRSVKFKIFYRGGELQDDCILGDCGICSGSRIFLDV